MIMKYAHKISLESVAIYADIHQLVRMVWLGSSLRSWALHRSGHSKTRRIEHDCHCEHSWESSHLNLSSLLVIVICNMSLAVIYWRQDYRNPKWKCEYWFPSSAIANEELEVSLEKSLSSASTDGAQHWSSGRMEAESCRPPEKSI